MPDEAKQKVTFKSPLIGAQAVPTILDTTTKLDIDTNKVLIDNIIEGATNGILDTGAIENFTTIFDKILYEIHHIYVIHLSNFQEIV